MTISKQILRVFLLQNILANINKCDAFPHPKYLSDIWNRSKRNHYSCVQAQTFKIANGKSRESVV